MEPELVFLDFVAKQLVEYPDEVRITKNVIDEQVWLELAAHKNDLGRIIGKKGATAHSLRVLLRALGAKNNTRYNLKVVEGGE